MPHPALVDQVRQRLRLILPSSHCFVGSQSEGSATPLSDWDLKIETTDARRVFADLSSIISTFDPLVAFGTLSALVATLWRSSPVPSSSISTWTWRRYPRAPLAVTNETLQAVDAHFWDWSLWLAGKALKGQQDLVQAELAKMHRYLLEPLGAPQPPQALNDAVTTYLRARDDAEARFGTRVAVNSLEAEVRAALHRHGFGS